MKKETIKISGMHCASCSTNIKLALEKYDKIKKAEVNFATKKASVEFNENEISLEEIKKIIQSTGFQIEEKRDEVKNKKAAEKAARTQRLKVIAAILMTIPIFLRMFWKWEVPGELWGVSITNWIQHDLAFLVVFITGWQFHSSAFEQIKRLQTNMDTLISLGTLSAYFYSLWAMFYGGHIYFESAAAITSLILLGKYLELKSTNKASRAMEKLMELGVKKANIILPNGKEKEKEIDEIKIGEIFIVRPGEKIPLDAVVIEGESAINESMLTGESLPVSKSINSKIFGATLNINGVIQARVTKTQNETMLAQIIRTVEEAQSFKAPIQKLADKISSIFVPTVVTISILTFIGWYIKTNDFSVSLINAVAVLIISCPCALGIATPIAIMIGTGVGAQNGILIKNGESFEKAKNIDTVIFDKTGTLTKGEPKVQDIVVNPKFNFKSNQIIKIAHSLSLNSKHPISKAITNYGEKIKAIKIGINNFEEVIGKGITGKCAQHNVDLLLGNITLLEKFKIDTKWAKEIISKEETGGTIVFLVHTGNTIGYLKITDEIKETAEEAIEKLKLLKLPVIMMSGDNEVTTKNTALKIGIEKYIAEVLPQDKQKEVKKLQENNKRTVFVGDGINDAPSLVQSNLGIAFGSGSDIAKESGDIIIIKDNPLKVVEAIKLSRKTFNIIKQNLFWAFFYNVLAIPLAMMGLVNPMIGAIAMSFSDITIIGNSLRIYKK